MNYDFMRPLRLVNVAVQSGLRIENMACYKHEAEETVASCLCGRSLCSACSERFEPLSCEKCALASVQSQRRGIYRDFAITAALFGCGFLVIESGSKPINIWIGLLMGYLYAGIRVGWINLSGWRSWQAIMANPLFFFLKLVAAALVGLIALPLQIISHVRSLTRLALFERRLTMSD